MTYEELIMSPDADGIEIVDRKFNSERIRGLYCDGTIAVNSSITTDAEKSCILAEELGHYHTSFGHIIDLKNSSNAKQEHRARMWGYNRQIGLAGIIECYKAGCCNSYDMAEYLGITEVFLTEALQCYRQKYGVCTQYKNYIIYFEPIIAVLELI